MKKVSKIPVSSVGNFNKSSDSPDDVVTSQVPSNQQEVKYKFTMLNSYKCHLS